MSTDGKQKLLGIEFGRGIAATLVVLYHTGRHLEANGRFTALTEFFQFGHTGVDFFFVLSGFIIFYVHSKDFDKPSALARYGERRFTRIYPLYWVATLFLVLVQVIHRGQGQDWTFVIGSMSLYPMGTLPVIGVAWTLQHEVLFYLFFAVLLIDRRIGVIIFGVWFALILLNYTTDFARQIGPLARKVCQIFNLQFFMGMAAAWLTQKVKPRGLPNLLAGMALFLFFGILENLGMLDEFGKDPRIFYGLSSFLLVVGLANLGNLERWSASLLRTLGEASYAIYLTHLYFIGVVYALCSRVTTLQLVPTWIVFALLVAAGIAGGVLVSRYVEYPLMGCVHRYWPRKTQTPA